MDVQDFRSLQEAYLEVVSNQLDEISVELARKAVKERQKRTDDLMDLDTLGQTNKPSAETEISHNKLDDNKRRLRNKIRAQKSSPTPRAKLNVEQVDLYDIILSHLLDEGYAETPEAAEAIMVNMSEEWRENIVEKSGEQPLPYGRMMKKSDKLAGSNDPEEQKRAAKIYLAANAPKGPKVKVRK